jgi:uridine kinase
MRVDEAVARVVERLTPPPNARLTLVAIDGMGASGKSTLAAALARALPGRLAVVHGDDFYGPEGRDWRSWSPQQGYEGYFDHIRLEEQVLQPLIRGEPARFQRYDWSTNELAEWVEVAPNGLVLVEGVYLLRARLRQFWDLSIYVHTPRRTRLSRAYERGENDSGWIEKWSAAEDYYEAAEAPAQSADLIVHGY